MANHPEYPSASTGACVSHAETQRLFYGNDALNWDVTFEAGSSSVESGYLPRRNTTYHFKSLTQFETECGQSRLWAGVHFQDAIDSIKPIAKEIGRRAFEFVKKHHNAEPAPPPHHAPAPHHAPGYPQPHAHVPHAPHHTHEPLKIAELPPSNPFSHFSHAAPAGGYSSYHYPHVGVTPAPVAPAAPVGIPSVTPTPFTSLVTPQVPFRSPKSSLNFNNHFSFSGFGKKK